MCGITGILQVARASRSGDLTAISRMTARLGHRGPDADGSWCDREAGVALGHRRIAIFDLTDAGRQYSRWSLIDVPIGAWLTRPLRSWAAGLLSERRLHHQSLLDARRVQSCWMDHLSWRPPWAVLMLQYWLETTVSRTSGSADILEPAQ